MDTVLATWISDGWLDAARIFGIAAAAYLLAMWVAAVVWTHRDITSRTTDSTLRTLSVLLVAVFSVPGVLLYLALRPPDTLEESYARRIEEEAFARELQQASGCPACGRAVREDFRNCPYCRAELAARCTRCERQLNTTWVMCPFCATERQVTQPAPAPAAPRPAAAATRPRPAPARPQLAR